MHSRATVPLVVKFCPLADYEHALDRRQYAHVFHYPGVICVAPAFDSLPLPYRVGILVHEVGHIIAGPGGSEDEADRVASCHGGFPVLRVDSSWGDRLEYVPRRSLAHALRWLSRWVDLSDTPLVYP